MNQTATAADIRRGDVFTWSGKKWIAAMDARPSSFRDSVDVWRATYRPATNGTYELGADLVTCDAILATTPVTIHERGAKVHHVTDGAHDDTPDWQVLSELSEIADARKKARREYDERDEDFRLVIKQAIHNDIPVAEIKRRTGLSRERIYQIRDDRR